MKKNQLIVLGAIVAILSPSLCSAQGRPRPRPGGLGPIPGNRGDVGDFAELGAIRDRLEAYHRLNAGGAKFYPKEQAELRKKHARLYDFIRQSVVEDRISEKQSRIAIDQLLLIGAEHLEGDTRTDPRLHALRLRVEELRSDKVDESILTPVLNKSQFRLDEIHRFAQDGDILSTGETSSLRRKLDRLESKEDRAKDGELSDRDREKLIEESREIWRSVVKDVQD